MLGLGLALAGHGGHLARLPLLGVLPLLGGLVHGHVGQGCDQVVEADGGLGGVLDGGLGPLHRRQHRQRLLQGAHEGGGPGQPPAAAQGGPHQVLHEGLHQGHLLHRRPPLQLPLLGEAVVGADAGVFAQDAGINARVLDDGEQVGGQATVLEQVEEALHVSERLAVAVAVGQLLQALPLPLQAQGGEDAPGLLEAEEEAAELQVPRLVGGVDLVDAEVAFLVLELVHRRRQEDGRPLGGGGLGPHPADALLGQRLGRVDGHVRPRQRLAVEAQDIAHPAQLQPRGEGVQHLLGAAGLQAEVGLAPLLVGLQHEEPLPVPGLQLAGLQAGQHLGQGLEELHGRHRRGAGQLLGQVQQLAVALGGHLGEGTARLGEVGEGLPPLLADDAAGQGQEAGPLGGLHLGQQRRPPLQVGAGIGPAGAGQLLGEAQEGQSVAPLQGPQHVGGHPQTVGGQVVRAVAEDVEEAHQHRRLAQGEGGEEDGAVLEELDGQGGGAPGALVEVAAQAHPAPQPLGADDGQGPRAGPIVGGGQGRGDGGQLAPVASPVPELARAQEGEHLGGGQVVFGAGLPGPPGQAGQL